MKFDFEEINLIPQKSIVESRSECDTSIKFGNFEFKMPVIPANMECVLNTNLAIKLAEKGYFYIMHRFENDILSFIRQVTDINRENFKWLDCHAKVLPISISIGVNDDSYTLLENLQALNLKVDYITIDIAHGHSIKMEKMLKHLKEIMPDVFIIAGNVTTLDAVSDLAKWGADSVKVGIGPGCFTPDSLVLTDKGYKSLQNINIGDNVLTHKNNLKKVLNKISYIGEQDLLKINNLPACSQTHEFYVINRIDKELVNESNLDEYAYWVQAKDLDKTKHLLIKNNNFYTGKNKFYKEIQF